ncbi:receptor like protein 21-like isoform X2 [Carya illinoinensis]|uniref:receptor like protein 21-like isoform X2 n=1 Tax=Carya illinoinensis TaxID=32201 RepID=UPI001C71BCE6|nr:receptor like protein 21-like isoform X2 [Carya illinoinensis]
MDASFANKAMIFLIWFMALPFCPSAWVEAGCSKEQNRALLEIRNSTNGLAFDDFDGSHCCHSRHSIRCDKDHGKVTSIVLSMDHKKVPSITWYPNVTLFTLFNELEELDLGSMNIGGELQAFCELKRLKYLRKLYLGNNILEGNIPSCLERFESLEVLDLSLNCLQGNLPSSIFSNQSMITKFKVSGNRLEGELSFSIFANASSLHYLDLSNKLEVETESSSWVPTFQLGLLNLASCSLNKKNGHIVPSFISTQYSLHLLDLSYNSIGGSVPCQLLFNMNITSLYLSGNEINGSFLDCSANGTSPLESLDISDNHVKGFLPENIGYLLPHLICVDMSSNALEGNIPWSFGYPPLFGVDLSHNMLSGTVPQSLTETGSRLLLLDLSNNKLQGQMLPKDANMTMLRILRLSSNHFEGVISPTLINSPYLLILDVQDNDLSGNIPEWLYDHSHLVALILSGNRFEGHLTQRLCRMKTLQGFVVSHNRLSGGSIPSQMGELSQIRFLNLSNNSLTGSIPISFQNLRSVEGLDLSHNKLRGRIPSELVGLTSLSVFSVAYNNLSGRIPFERQFSTFTSQCYEGNPELYRDPLPRKCSTTNQSEPEEKQGIRMIDHPFFFYAFVTVSYALGFWAFFGILIIKKNWRHKYFKAVDRYIESLFDLLSYYI